MQSPFVGWRGLGDPPGCRLGGLLAGGGWRPVAVAGFA